MFFLIVVFFLSLIVVILLRYEGLNIAYGLLIQKKKKYSISKYNIILLHNMIWII